jgi:bacteriorhodopsin
LTNLVFIGIVAFILIVAYEYGWPPVELFYGWLRTERSRTIARVIGWVLTVGLLVSMGLRVWNNTRDLWRGI